MAKNNAHSFKNMLTVAKKSPQLQFHSSNNRPVSNSDTWNEALHPRHPKGAEDGKGGEFAPKDKLTKGDLVENREKILAKIKELGISDAKTFMELMLMDIDFFKNGSVMDLVSEVYNTHFMERNSGSKLAETMGKISEREEFGGRVWNPITSRWEKKK